MERIRQVNPLLGESEISNILSSVENNWLTEGPFTAELLEKSAVMVGSSNILPAPNGTLGLYLALLALNLPKGGKVIIPSFTFYASAMAVLFAGLVPVFVDVDPNTFCIDLEKTEELIDTETVAIMPVHVYGTACDMAALCKLSSKYGLKIIEDAAQSFGVSFQGKHTGVWGDIGVFSFFADKTITMGEGALIVTKNTETFERLKLLRNQGRPNSGTFIHPELGMNFRITDLQAAIGVAQLARLTDVADQRINTYENYLSKLAAIDGINIHTPTTGSDYIPFRLALTSSYKAEIDQALNEGGVDTRSFFYPMHLQPKLTHYKHNADMSISEKLYNTGVCLPIHNKITKKNVEYICKIIRSIINKENIS